MHAETGSTVSRLRKRLENHPRFRGRTRLLTIEAIGRSIVLSGRLPHLLSQTTAGITTFLTQSAKGGPDAPQGEDDE